MPAKCPVWIGTAGWSVSSHYSRVIPPGGTHLERYARAFPVVEITSSFYRHHRADTYARWARSVGPDFRFAVKTPRELTHDGRLASGRSTVRDRFLSEVAGLGEKLRVLLIQMPPSLEFERAAVRRFFGGLQSRIGKITRIVCEPRHVSWATPAVDALLQDLGVSRAAVNPARFEVDDIPGGDVRLAYFRMHGSPWIYYSNYGEVQLRTLADLLQECSQSGREVWCVFDNTAHGHALGNALSVCRFLRQTCV